MMIHYSPYKPKHHPKQTFSCNRKHQVVSLSLITNLLVTLFSILLIILGNTNNSRNHHTIKIPQSLRNSKLAVLLCQHHQQDKPTFAKTPSLGASPSQASSTFAIFISPSLPVVQMLTRLSIFCSLPIPLTVYFVLSCSTIGFPASMTWWFNRSMLEKAAWSPYHCAAYWEWPSALVIGSEKVAAGVQRLSLGTEKRN